MEDKQINDLIDNLIDKLMEANQTIINLQERIIKARKYLLENIKEEDINYWQKSKLFEILGDDKNE